jgi:plasmid stabilization system protein ParE
MLAENPHAGRIELLLEDLPGGFRSFVVQKRHKVVYNIDGDTINVAFIWDCRRNPLTLRKIAEQDNGTD